jgi:hypothetical protein
VTSPIAGLSGLARTDQLDGYLDITNVANAAIALHSQGWHLVPTAPVGKAAYVCNGHFDTDVAGGNQTAVVQELLTAGWDVFLYLMPRDPLAHPTIFNYSSWECRAFAPFFDMPIRALNLATSLGMTHHTVIGLSGGGWTAAFWPAVDPRVVRSFAVCGTLPLYMRAGYAVGDAEQWWPHLYAHAGWLDLYVLAATGPGRELWIMYVGNDASFGPSQYDPNTCPDRLTGLTWAEAIADFVAETDAVATALGGRVQSLTVPTGGHSYTAEAIQQIMARLP